MIIRQFRVQAQSPDEACAAAHRKCEIVGRLAIWQAVDGSYECQAVIKEEQVIPAPGAGASSTKVQ